jgi:hypothetical protein
MQKTLVEGVNKERSMIPGEFISLCEQVLFEFESDGLWEFHKKR